MSGGHVTMKVEGLKELEQALVAFHDKAPGIIAKGLRAPMEQVLVDAKTLVPKRTGELADALDLTPVKRATAKRASSDAEALSEIGLRIRKAKEGKIGTRGAVKGGLEPRSYWHLVEFGTSHSAAKPYIRPAFDKNVQHLIDGLKTEVRAGLERVRARYARGRRR